MTDLYEIINMLDDAQYRLVLAMKERDPDAFPIWRLREALRHTGIAVFYLTKADNEKALEPFKRDYKEGAK